MTLPLTQFDILALGLFLLCWLGLEYLIDYSHWRRRSLSNLMAERRSLWMKTMAMRDLRMIDTQIIAGLQTGASFFGSAAILAIGGSFALLGATDQVLQIYRDLPISADVTRQLWELRVFGLIVIFVYSFFKFAWAYRLLNYCSILIGGVPSTGHSDLEEREKAAEIAAQMNIIGGRHFTAGLRGIFFALAYLGWFLGPELLVLSTLFVVFVLMRRQYFSHARAILVDETQA